MIRHMVLFKVTDDFPLKIQKELSKDCKKLNELSCVKEINLILNPLKMSTHNVLMECLFEDEMSLKKYQTDSLHLSFQKKYQSLLKDRVCFDYIV